MKAFFQKLAGEILQNGKSLIAWTLYESPLSTMPGISDAMQKVYENPADKVAWGNFIVQGLWTVASGHRAFKILDTVLKK